MNLDREMIIDEVMNIGIGGLAGSLIGFFIAALFPSGPLSEEMAYPVIMSCALGGVLVCTARHTSLTGKVDTHDAPQD